MRADNMTNALKLLANLQDKENFIKVVYDGNKEGSRRKMVTAWRRFIEVDCHKALVSVKLLDQHRVVKEVLAQGIREGPEEFT